MRYLGRRSKYTSSLRFLAPIAAFVAGRRSLEAFSGFSGFLWMLQVASVQVASVLKD